MTTEHASTRSTQIVAADDADHEPSDVNQQAQWATRVMQAYRASLINVHRQLAPLRS
ncbi:hypothetical protein [Novosphingobium kaempferiae]|uniref:hypothetical protein n=1 Tax=Novosphingobium kaempferiae TaxID=2896849 RepID=UPI001E55E52A|nr:hypothetical protein [Novosphingobium kaempferiae]